MLATLEVLQPRDLDEAAQLIDRCMRPDSELSMTADFPLLIGPRARSHRLIVKEGGRIVSHVAARIGTVRTPIGTLFSCVNMGAVCTDPGHRGSGFAHQLMEEQLRYARDLGVEMAMLWSEVDGFYEKHGFHYAGCESRFLVNSVDLARVSPCLARWSQPEDTHSLIKIRTEDACAMGRPFAEASVLFNLPLSRTLVANRGESIEAYITYGKGLDFEGAICEWGGDAQLVASLVKTLTQLLHLEAVLILGPRWHDEYRRVFSGMGSSEEVADLGMFAILNSSAMIQAVDPGQELGLPTDPEQLLYRLIGRPSTPERRSVLPFYVWGLDSM